MLWIWSRGIEDLIYERILEKACEYRKKEGTGRRKKFRINGIFQLKRLIRNLQNAI